MSKLAIVIPAYKIDFFPRVLDSLSVQTCKDFTVYIGDDNSPNDFESIIQSYYDKLDIVYQKFQTNIGGQDLVAQWKRCIDLTNDEPWIWLFSDDDLISNTCVESFYEEINSTKKTYDLYHFDVDIIDSNDNILKTPASYPDVISNKEFYKRKASARLDCFVVEYIFSRNIYNQVGGFEPFDLAWGSDIATWVKMSQRKGIKTIKGPKVLWRQSDKNITPNKERAMVERKFGIDIDFLSWINNYFDSSDIISYNQYILFRLVVHYSLIIDKVSLKKILDKAVVYGIIQNSYARFLLAIIRLIVIAKIIKTYCM